MSAFQLQREVKCGAAAAATAKLALTVDAECRFCSELVELLPNYYGSNKSAGVILTSLCLPILTYTIHLFI